MCLYAYKYLSTYQVYTIKVLYVFNRCVSYYWYDMDTNRYKQHTATARGKGETEEEAEEKEEDCSLQSLWCGESYG